ncbi:integrase, catalytic region, zinc finger, CCHC-type containing protein [Tanacetum coccineum]
MPQPYSDLYNQAPKSQRSNPQASKQSSSTRPSASTRHKGKEITKPVTPQSESVFEEDSDPKQAQRDKDMQKNLALLAKYFKKLYKPTNNNLQTSSNSKNKTEDTTPRQSGSATEWIQCFNCKGFGHYAKECRKPRVNHSTSVSRPPLKSYKVKDKVVTNNSQVKFTKKEVEDHHRISSISKKTKSVTAYNDNSNSKTSNVNAVCAECGKCVFNSNHDACVSKYLNDVNARTKKPKFKPRSSVSMTSAHNRSELRIHNHNNEPSSCSLSSQDSYITTRVGITIPPSYSNAEDNSLITRTSNNGRVYNLSHNEEKLMFLGLELLFTEINCFKAKENG